jgi:hypothetical protein
MPEEKPLVNKKYLLEKYPGKGGWTFARIPEIPQDKKAYFGWVKVKGSIDGYAISKYNLMPMGDGHLFLPVKAEIRKKINKQEGDLVHVILYPDLEPLEMPTEMLLCLKEEPAALKYYNSLSESEQKHYLDWIYASKKEEVRVERLATSINRLLKKQRLPRDQK